MHRKHKPLLVIMIAFIFVISSGCSQNNPEITKTPLTLTTETIGDISTPEKLSSPAVSNNVYLSDGLGREIHLEQPAKRIVSLAPSNTEILFAVGAGSQVIGRDSFSDYPEAALQIDDVGGGYGEFDLEKIVSLKPDLVLASSLNPEELVTKLEGLDLQVFYLSNPDDLEDMYGNLITVGQLTDHQSDAELLVDSLKERVEKITEKTKNVENRPLVFYELDATDPAAPWTSGKGTFIDTLLNLAGAKNLGSSMDAAWAQISIEEIIAQDPDVILVGDMVGAGITIDSVKARPGWDALTAIKNDRTYSFDDDLVSRPGPRLVDGLEALARLLHPELFQ